MYCRECGTKMGTDDKFCLKCGTQTQPLPESNKRLKSVLNKGYLICAISLFLMCATSLVGNVYGLLAAFGRFYLMPLLLFRIYHNVMPLVGSLIFIVGSLIAAWQWKSKLLLITFITGFLSYFLLSFHIFLYLIVSVTGGTRGRFGLAFRVWLWDYLWIFQIAFVIAILTMLFIPLANKTKKYRIAVIITIAISALNIGLFSWAHSWRGPHYFNMLGFANSYWSGPNLLGYDMSGILIPLLYGGMLIWAGMLKKEI